MEYQVMSGDFSSYGVSIRPEGMNFCFSAEKKYPAAVLLYEKDHQIPVRVEITDDCRIGDLCAVMIQCEEPLPVSYSLEINHKSVPDPYARNFRNKQIWADPMFMGESLWQTGISSNALKPESPYVVNQISPEDIILYKLNVRGFTKNDSSVPQKEKGTFRGLIRKIPYLKELGINTIELMPCYEFEEKTEKKQAWHPGSISRNEEQPTKEWRLNCWGYGEGHYFAPKASFAADADAVREMQDCIRKLHSEKINCIMEMDFGRNLKTYQITDCLRFWKINFGIDGFHLLGDKIPLELILEDPALADCIFLVPWDYEADRVIPCTDSYLYSARKMLGSGYGNLEELLEAMRGKSRNVNYICDHNGYTLYDLFSYETKHNHANGEHNQDGADWNFSRNFGVEGITKSRNILDKRLKYMKNAIAILMLSRGIPLIMSGDESANTQNGNNNCYCQDNETGWKDWSRSSFSSNILDFTSSMISFRREHDLLKRREPFFMRDTLGTGYPDLSYHGESPWITYGLSSQKSVGVLYGGKYGTVSQDDLFVGMNFSDIKVELAIPRIPGVKEWKLVMRTDQKDSFATEERIKGNTISLEPGSILILTGRQSQKTPKQIKR